MTLNHDPTARARLGRSIQEDKKSTNKIVE